MALFVFFLYFRSSNAAIRSFGLAIRPNSRCAVFTRNSRCEKYPVQTGWTCIERVEALLPIQTDLGEEEEMCGVCARLYNETCELFDEEMVHPQHRRKHESKPRVPQNIEVLEVEFERTSILQREFKGTECESHYNMKKTAAEASYNKAMKEWTSMIAERKEKKRNETRRLYSLGRFGDPQDIRRLLFHVSACLLDTDDFKEIVFAVNSYSGIYEAAHLATASPPPLARGKGRVISLACSLVRKKFTVFFSPLS